MDTETHEVFFLFKIILINYFPATAYIFLEKKAENIFISISPQDSICVHASD